MRIYRFIILILAMALIAAFGAGCAKTSRPIDVLPEATEPAQVQPPSDLPDAKDSQELRQALEKTLVDLKQARRTYLIGPGDLLRVKVWMREDLSKEGVVRDDGTFFVPLVGNMKAQGQTATQFQKSLTQALSEYLRSPQVDVEIAEYNSKFFYLIGQVREPGHYAIRATTTVMEAVTTGKGFTDKANLGEAYLLHRNVIVPVDFVALFEKGRMENNIHLDDGDVIYVPSTDHARVYVLGEVLRPAAVPVPTGRISIAEAIAGAGGFNETTAYKSAIKIIRGDLTNPEVYTVNYNDVLKGKVGRGPVLKPGDIVYVPASGLTKWDRVTGQLLPSLSRIVVDAAAVDALTSQ